MIMGIFEYVCSFSLHSLLLSGLIAHKYGGCCTGINPRRNPPACCVCTRKYITRSSILGTTSALFVLLYRNISFPAGPVWYIVWFDHRPYVPFVHVFTCATPPAYSTLSLFFLLLSTTDGSRQYCRSRAPPSHLLYIFSVSDVQAVGFTQKAPPLPDAELPDVQAGRFPQKRLLFLMLNSQPDIISNHGPDHTLKSRSHTTKASPS